MKLSISISRALIVAGSAAVVLFSSFMPLPAARQKPALRTIIIDAGHGGRDAGAKGLITTEAEVTLDIAMKLGHAIEKEFPEMKVVYTRTSSALPGGLQEPNLANRYRAEMANQAKGDLFLSIHCNSNGKPAGGYYAKRVIGYKNKTTYTGKGKKRKKKIVKAPIYESYWVKNNVKGTETYIWAADRSGSKSDYINETGETSGENVEDTLNVLDLSSPEAKIRGQLYEKLYFNKSATVATMVEDEFKNAGRTSYGVKQRNYKGIWVLQATGMPSILVETGFITNKEEEEYLNSDEGQDEIVSNILSALKKYKAEIETSKATTSN
jgi:N-acetylmuramoyl-L-alanine amidase